MKKSDISNRHALALLVLAAIFWYLTFAAKWLNFWLSMMLAVSILTCLGLCFGGDRVSKAEITINNSLMGVISAAFLYGIFWCGNQAAHMLFQFSKPEVAAIYNIRNEGQALLIAVILLFITSPGEELFWRGYLQKWAMQRFGPLVGWLAGAAAYASVHIVSGNLMLILAALVAGLFWGFLYWRSGSLYVCIVSHALWTVGIFVIWPVR